MARRQIILMIRARWRCLAQLIVFGVIVICAVALLYTSAFLFMGMLISISNKLHELVRACVRVCACV